MTARHNFSARSEALLNAQISTELTASQFYLSLYAYYLRDSVNLRGFAKYMKKQSDEEREHAVKFIDYLALRGGKVIISELPKPKPEEPSSPLHGFELALELEKEVTTKLENLMSAAGEEKDPDLEHFIEHFIEDQKKSLRELNDHIINIKRCGDGIGLYTYDKSLQ